MAACWKTVFERICWFKNGRNEKRKLDPRLRGDDNEVLEGISKTRHSRTSGSPVWFLCFIVLILFKKVSALFSKLHAYLRPLFTGFGASV